MHFTWVSLCAFVVCFSWSAWKIEACGQIITTASEHHHISLFRNPDFWGRFVDLVESRKAWKCNFPSEILLSNLESDAALYGDNSAIFRNRRSKALPWLKNDSLWIETMLGACKEIADGEKGKFSRELEDLHMLEALSDFVEHIDYFHSVATRMQSRGLEVPFVNGYMHDIDKLDPVMLVGYSERFEDNISTSVWEACVKRHTTVNPHHEAHCIWHDCCSLDRRDCDAVASSALREMICDKISRHVQKDLNGALEEDMWDVDMNFFKGLSQDWYEKVKDMLEQLKRKDA